jgi:hypothetical protein
VVERAEAPLVRADRQGRAVRGVGEEGVAIGLLQGDGRK